MGNDLPCGINDIEMNHIDRGWRIGSNLELRITAETDIARP